MMFRTQKHTKFEIRKRMLPDHPKRRLSSRPVQQKPVCLSSTGTITRIPFLCLDVIPAEVVGRRVANRTYVSRKNCRQIDERLLVQDSLE
jgi:hypothetical protein